MAAERQKCACPPLQRSKLGENVLELIMDRHGRAPLGLPNEAYYSNFLGRGHIKEVIDAITLEIDSFNIGITHRSLCLALKRTGTTMASLMRKRVHTMMRIGGLYYPRCFVEGISKNAESMKVRNTTWKSNWVKIETLECVSVDLPY